MTRVFAVANQKGGVAKTTTVQTLGAALAELGERVLLVDLDPQACLTFAVGLDPEALTPTLHDVLLGRAKVEDAVIGHRAPDDPAGEHRPRRLRGAPARPHRAASTRSTARSPGRSTTSTPCSSTARRRSVCSP